MEPEQITFTRHEDGSITVDKFPDEIEVSADVLQFVGVGVECVVFSIDDFTLDIQASNGHARYEYMMKSLTRPVTHYRKVHGEIREIEPAWRRAIWGD